MVSCKIDSPGIVNLGMEMLAIRRTGFSGQEPAAVASRRPPTSRVDAAANSLGGKLGIIEVGSSAAVGMTALT